MTLSKQEYRRPPHRRRWLQISAALLCLLAVLLIIVFFNRDRFQNQSAQSSQTNNTNQVAKAEKAEVSDQELQINEGNQALLRVPSVKPERFYKASQVNIAYPKEGVRGIYLSAHGMGTPSILERNINLLDSTGLNSVVIDVKSDWGSIATQLPTDNDLVKKNEEITFNGQEMMQTFEEKQIYPIARITTFKDTYAAKAHPDWSFKKSNGEIWSDAGGQTFLNPYNKDVWAYVVDVAKGAAELGFKDIQFDYVRFPEGFENFGTSLVYDMGDYAHYGKDSVEGRCQAITDFLAYAQKELRPYGVDVSADIFGYVTTIGSAPGIGQDFTDIANTIDVVSSMIYPSHWSNGDFGFTAPDLEPYGVVDNYMDVEDLRLENIGGDHAHSRPWLQAFTASYLANGTYQEYTNVEIEEQIQALRDHGVYEYLLWNAANDYPSNVDY
ncbi:putative glycoside hydrolase [Aerococcus urinae]|nr:MULTISPECIES: putative glycoside hydrolase [Aerococcus]MCY3066770.1 putative glycoside hydrolase [Aerococcus mictus]MCY3069508.1 putative glycoside hydrolase [Aerococcus mictus]MCY3072113.1 putative glycoside hydrolase [Aerococcus mictus]MCY3079527.1 putative glycoside hydrolase [Aerococcus mictus]MCY3081368.1 putative glycoside hydrolase [Aerococcus mictus]